ncbi:hypothetical protein [Marinococcus sp. PL1-022]|nr:hypothetical protein [Marinococcus sp. PL1-022]MDX6153100.1 hypothetical protein [Marinococcus sp. PL1-022]
MEERIIEALREIDFDQAEQTSHYILAIKPHNEIAKDWLKEHRNK